MKTACEVYLIANLACYLKFDSPSPTVDSGPNRLTIVNTGGISITNGRINQAMQFVSSSTFLTITDVSALKSPANAFSVSMWISPANINGGTLIHASTQINGLFNVIAYGAYGSHKYLSRTEQLSDDVGSQLDRSGGSERSGFE